VVAILIALGLLGTTITSVGIPWTGVSLEVTVLLAIGFVVTDFRPFSWLTQSADMTASWVFAYALLLAGAPATAIACHVLVRGISDFSVRKRVLRSLFNMSVGTLAFGSAWWILVTLGSDQTLAQGSTLDVMWLLVVAAGAVPVLLISGTFTGAMIALDQRTPPWPTIRDTIRLNLIADGTLLPLAPVFVLVLDRGLVLAPCLLLSGFIVHKSVRSAAIQRHDATHDPLTALPNRRFFLEQARYDSIMLKHRTKCSP